MIDFDVAVSLAVLIALVFGPDAAIGMWRLSLKRRRERNGQ